MNKINIKKIGFPLGLMLGIPMSMAIWSGDIIMIAGTSVACGGYIYLYWAWSEGKLHLKKHQ
jgi:hypothetical protein